MTSPTAIPHETPPRRLLVHTRHQVIEVPLTGDVQLDALLKRLASRGGFVIEERITDEDGAPCR